MPRSSDIGKFLNNQVGEWRIVDQEVSLGFAKLYNIRQLENGNARFILPGKYKALYRGDILVMHNSKPEVDDLVPIINAATGNVLITGLGLGCVVSEILKKDSVASITVLEKSPEVIELIGGYYTIDPRVIIHNADAFTWEPPDGIIYDAVWHDIWDTICIKNLPDIERLHNKYGKISKWQESWCRQECYSCGCVNG